MSDIPRRLGSGAIAGALATIPMTALMVAARRRGLMRAQQPPVRITEEITRNAGSTLERAASPIAGFAHLAFGAAAGALFAGFSAPRAPVVSGAAYGSLVWLASYAGWLPALHLMPRPEDDEPGRPTTMIAAHLVYGACLALVLRWLAPQGAK